MAVYGTAVYGVDVYGGASSLTITTTTLPGASLTAAYSQTIVATGGTAPYTWSVFSGALPTSITLASSTGILSGTPTVAGTYNFTIRVTDNVAATFNQALAIIVAAAPVITTTTLPNGTVGAAYSQALVTTGGTAPLAYSLFSGTLPAGVTLSTGGALSGTPTTATTYNFTVRVTDAAGAVDNQALTVIVGAPAAPIISGITVSSLGPSSAVVGCTTDIPALVRINYGLTAGYGSATADGPLGTTHSRLVSPLSPSTLYHYQVRAANGASVTLSGDGTFSTTAAPVSTRNLPTYSIEVAWSRTRTGVITIGTSTIGGTDQIGGLFSHYTFNAITADVKDITITRGRTGDEGAMTAGSCALTLVDTDGTYNPENAASPLAPNVLPLRPIRVKATHLSIPYGLFFGWITRIEHDPSPNVRETRIEAVDFFHWLDVCKPVLSLPETTVGSAIEALLSACGLSDPAYISLDTGHRIPFLLADGTKSALQIIQELLVVDMGVFFVDGSGRVTYHDATRRYATTVVDDTFTNALLGDARPSTDILNVRNGWTVTREGGVPQTVYDAASRDASAYGPRDGDPITSPYLMSDTAAGSLAAFKVEIYKVPTSPVGRLRLSNASDTLIAKQLGRDVGQRVRVVETRGGTDVTGFLEGVSHHVWEAGKFHEVTYTLSKRRFDTDANPTAVIGTAVIGAARIGY